MTKGVDKYPKSDYNCNCPISDFEKLNKEE